MFPTDFLGKEDEPFVAAHFSPAVASDPSGILFLCLAVGTRVVEFDFLLNNGHPVIAVRFDG